MTSIANICRLNLNGQITERTADDSVWEITVPAGSRAELSALAFRGPIRTRIILAGPGASCLVKCVYLAAGQDKINLDFDIIHQSGRTQADQLVRGIATDQACVHFAGVIRIPRDSQKCDSAQNHRGVVLTDGALISAIPELEIFADDVKCAHGSAIGPMNAYHLFYLMSRGISEQTARALLLHAFVQDALDPAFSGRTDEWMEKYV